MSDRDDPATPGRGWRDGPDPDGSDLDPGWDDDDPIPPGEPARSARRGPRATPLRVTFAIALVGSLSLVAYGLLTRGVSQLPVLTAGGFVTGIVLALLAVAGAFAAYRRAAAGQEGRAFAYALLGGLAAVLAVGALSAASILALVQKD